jgi:hypothetical protein
MARGLLHTIAQLIHLTPSILTPREGRASLRWLHLTQVIIAEVHNLFAL